MGRSFQADDAVEAYIEQLIKSGQWHIGLVVGQLTNNKDYVARLIRTPDPAEDEVSEEEEGEEVVTERKKEACLRPKSLDLTDEQWVSSHATQVNRMLLGGLDVIGVFALAPPNMMQSSQAKLRQVVFAVHKALSKLTLCDRENAITDRMVLQICSVARKLTCRTFDVADMKSTARPAEWRYVSGLLDRWSQLSTMVSVDVAITVPNDARTTTMHKQIQQGIQPFCKSIYNGMALLNGELRNDDEVLDQSEPRKGKSKDKANPGRQQFAVDLLDNMSDNNNVPDPTALSVKAILKVRGQMIGRSLVNNRATVRDAIEAVRSDVVRSLVSRCELLCEDLEVVEEHGARELYDTPVRVFTTVPKSSLAFCDYMFQDEKTQEVTERLKELLDIDVTEDDLELQCERHAEEGDWSSGVESEDGTEHSGGSAGDGSGLGAYLGMAVSGVVAAVVGVAYMMYGDS
ncbi:protein odr-4 homolog [Haliotis rubra]|uniref:protein odr-4 homolog n=1 Tax=Haliotis rubra TaxID=36100 RepID=UPI001EE52435|nr:protein odr-4 homolog [Haliotis rubra]XP_046558825.1 protein odr-4 homolog [Haliotis rubra]XP_046558826.1 protein odr-4 homolog [Haliotis rubra]